MIDFQNTRVIRIFISSTFRDMQDERDELMKKTFPVLRRKAAERDVTLTELDLRWGITPEESESGKVVEICLREIENSEPFFIGIIGNRYGWIPSAGDLEASLRERYAQVDRYVEGRLSVTEMEMQFGVLERPEELHAYFFIKAEETEDGDEPEKLAALKAAVRSNGRYPVSSYSSPEDLAFQVEDAFTKLLDELFPESALSELEKERIGQRSYLNSLCQNYIRTESNFSLIDGWMGDWAKHQLVITGTSGLGKSALVANWVKEKSKEELPYKVICHFVGNGGSLGSHGHVIKVLCDEIVDRYGFETEDKEAKADEKVLEELFNRVATEGDKPLVIVLDAINQIIDVDNSKQLNWLPIPPKKVKILFTTLEDDQTMAVFKNRHYPVFTLRPLTKPQRAEMVKEYLHLYSKKLQPYQIERIITDEQCKNTLVLKTFLDELVNFGIFERLDEKISSYLGSASVEDFYGILLKGYETDFGEPFVKHILSLIAVSRNGLSEDEILAITKETPLHWSQFYCSIRQHLIIKNGLISFAHSYIRKAVENQYLKGQGTWENDCRKEIVSFFDDAKTLQAIDEVPYQLDHLDDLDHLYGFLLDLEVFSSLFRNDNESLGKYWRHLRDRGDYSLETYLLLVERLPESKRLGILLELNAFYSTGVQAPELSLETLKSALSYASVEKERSVVMNGIGLSYILLGKFFDAIDYLLRASRITLTLKGEIHESTLRVYNNIGLAYGEIGEYQKALEYSQKALDISLSLFGKNHPDTSTCFDSLAAAYGNIGDYGKEMEYYQEALNTRLSVFGERYLDTIHSFNNVGLAYLHLDEYRKALDYQQKALESNLDIFGENHSDTATYYNNAGMIYGILGDIKKSLSYKMKALNIRLSLFGRSHPDTAVSFNNVGLSFLELGDYRKALEYEQEALGIRLELYGDRNTSVATSYNNVGCCYKYLGDYSNALHYLLLGLKIRKELVGESDLEVASSYDNIGNMYSVTGHFNEALWYGEKALEIRIKLLGNNHSDVGNSYNSLGGMYGRAGRIEEALDYKLKALSILNKYYGEIHPGISVLCNYIGAAYEKLAQKEKGLSYRLKALNIAMVIKDKKKIAMYSNRVGKAYRSIGQMETANEYFHRAAEKYREIGDDEQASANLKEVIELE